MRVGVGPLQGDAAGELVAGEGRYEAMFIVLLEPVGSAIPLGDRAAVAGDGAFVFEVRGPVVGQGLGANWPARLGRLLQRPGRQDIAQLEHEIPMRSAGTIVCENHISGHIAIRHPRYWASISVPSSTIIACWAFWLVN